MKLIEEIQKNYGNCFDDPDKQNIMIIVESIAICFQALIDKIEELKTEIKINE